MGKALVLATLFLLILVAGCSSGPAVGQVSGKVTFKGKPVTEGRITFFNAKAGYNADVVLGKDGRYTIETPEGGLMVGDYVVTITPLMHLINPEPTKTPPAPEWKPAPNIPMRYRSEMTSPLKVTVKEGPQELNFDMTPDPKR
jgi:hypothetical protein